jgi:hypothetical protein
MSLGRSPRIRWNEVSIAAAWAIIAALLVAFAINVWPAGTKDEQFLIPPALEYRSSGELVHPFWQKARDMDPTGEGRLVYHGFLLQLIVGTVALSPGYQGAHMVLMLILVAVLGVFSLAIVQVIRAFPGVPAMHGALLGVSAVAGLPTVLLGLGSRPEPLAMLIVLCAVLVMRRLDLRRQWIPAGIAVGLIGVTSPLPAIVAFVLFALYIHMRLRQRDALAGTVLAAGTATLSALAIVFLWYPFSLLDWLHGLEAHRASLGAPPQGIIYCWFTNPRYSFYGLLFLLAAALGALRLGRHRDRVKSRVGFIVSLAGLVIIVVESKLYTPQILYNLMVFSPLVYVAAIFAGLEICRDEAAAKGARRLCPALTAIIVMVFLATSLGFARTLVTFPAFLQRGVSYAEAKTRFEDLRTNASGSILITPALYGLVYKYDGISVMELPDQPIPKGYEFIMYSQVGVARQTPPEIDGYVLIEDRFDRNAPRIFGVKVANSTHGYDYAIYQGESGTKSSVSTGS